MFLRRFGQLLETDPGFNPKTSLAGIGAGVLAVAALVRVIRSQLFEVHSDDSLVFVVAIGLLVFLAALSVLIPARRAANADPIIALRNE